jgi:deoxyhypusine synthase
VCYLDNTVAFPILAAYALARRTPRPLKRLYDRRGAMMDQLLQAYKASRAERDQRAARATGGRER